MMIHSVLWLFLWLFCSVSSSKTLEQVLSRAIYISPEEWKVWKEDGGANFDGVPVDIVEAAYLLSLGRVLEAVEAVQALSEKAQSGGSPDRDDYLTALKTAIMSRAGIYQSKEDLKNGAKIDVLKKLKLDEIIDNAQETKIEEMSLHETEERLKFNLPPDQQAELYWHKSNLVAPLDPKAAFTAIDDGMKILEKDGGVLNDHSAGVIKVKKIPSDTLLRLVTLELPPDKAKDAADIFIKLEPIADRAQYKNVQSKAKTEVINVITEERIKASSLAPLVESPTGDSATSIGGDSKASKGESLYDIYKVECSDNIETAAEALIAAYKHGVPKEANQLEDTKFLLKLVPTIDDGKVQTEWRAHSLILEAKNVWNDLPLSELQSAWSETSLSTMKRLLDLLSKGGGHEESKKLVEAAKQALYVRLDDEGIDAVSRLEEYLGTFYLLLTREPLNGADKEVLGRLEGFLEVIIKVPSLTVDQLKELFTKIDGGNHHPDNKGSEQLRKFARKSVINYYHDEAIVQEEFYNMLSGAEGMAMTTMDGFDDIQYKKFSRVLSKWDAKNHLRLIEKISEIRGKDEGMARKVEDFYIGAIAESLQTLEVASGDQMKAESLRYRVGHYRLKAYDACIKLNAARHNLPPSPPPQPSCLVLLLLYEDEPQQPTLEQWREAIQIALGNLNVINILPTLLEHLPSDHYKECIALINHKVIRENMLQALTSKVKAKNGGEELYCYLYDHLLEALSESGGKTDDTFSAIAEIQVEFVFEYKGKDNLTEELSNYMETFEPALKHFESKPTIDEVMPGKSIEELKQAKVDNYSEQVAKVINSFFYGPPPDGYHHPPITINYGAKIFKHLLVKNVDKAIQFFIDYPESTGRELGEGEWNSLLAVMNSQERLDRILPLLLQSDRNVTGITDWTLFMNFLNTKLFHKEESNSKEHWELYFKTLKVLLQKDSSQILCPNSTPERLKLAALACLNVDKLGDLQNIWLIYGFLKDLIKKCYSVQNGLERNRLVDMLAQSDCPGVVHPARFIFWTILAENSNEVSIQELVEATIMALESLPFNILQVKNVITIFQHAVNSDIGEKLAEMIKKVPTWKGIRDSAVITSHNKFPLSSLANNSKAIPKIPTEDEIEKYRDDSPSLIKLLQDQNSSNISLADEAITPQTLLESLNPKRVTLSQLPPSLLIPDGENKHLMVDQACDSITNDQLELLKAKEDLHDTSTECLENIPNRIFKKLFSDKSRLDSIGARLSSKLIIKMKKLVANLSPVQVDKMFEEWAWGHPDHPYNGLFTPDKSGNLIIDSLYGGETQFNVKALAYLMHGKDWARAFSKGQHVKDEDAGIILGNVKRGAFLEGIEKYKDISISGERVLYTFAMARAKDEEKDNPCLVLKDEFLEKYPIWKRVGPECQYYNNRKGLKSNGGGKEAEDAHYLDYLSKRSSPLYLPTSKNWTRLYNLLDISKYSDSKSATRSTTKSTTTSSSSSYSSSPANRDIVEVVTGGGKSGASKLKANGSSNLSSIAAASAAVKSKAPILSPGGSKGQFPGLGPFLAFSIAFIGLVVATISIAIPLYLVYSGRRGQQV